MKQKRAIALADWDGWDFPDLPKGDTDAIEPSQATYLKESSEVLGAICSEIEKVENPFSDELDPLHHSGFKECRQTILSLLKNEKPTQEILDPDTSEKPVPKTGVESPTDYVGHGKGAHNP